LRHHEGKWDVWDWHLSDTLAAVEHDACTWLTVVRCSVPRLRHLRARLIGHSKHKSGALRTIRCLVALASQYGDLQTHCNRQVLAYRLMYGTEVLLTGAPQLLFTPQIRRNSILHVDPTSCSQYLESSSFYSLALVRRGKEKESPM
jgi:hypothetical protein